MIIGGRPETTFVALNDGAADREADAHPVALCRVERVEELPEVLWVDAQCALVSKMSLLQLPRLARFLRDLRGGLRTVGLGLLNCE